MRVGVIQIQTRGGGYVDVCKGEGRQDLARPLFFSF